jgi:glycerophosphoryl diester phosphodiesterase
VSALAPAFARRAVRCAQLPIAMAKPAVIARAHAAGLQVHIWTVNERSMMNSLLDLGVDGLMTDNTELLREVLIARGEWHPRALSGLTE